MKTIVLLFCVLCATAAFGQYSAGVSVLNSQPQMLVMAGHPERAAQHEMGSEQRILEGHVFVAAQGEIPLWEVAPKVVVTPLGDTARALRQEHAAAKKALLVWENQ